MSVINGVAKKYDGTAIDYVSIFNWADGKCIAQVVPDESGTWNYQHSIDLNVGITYVADGCKPATHGAYQLIGGLNELFQNNEYGVWYDPRDLSTLFQDVGGTIPVTKNNDRVALMLDKSGNNLHLYQPDLDKQPIYKTDGILHGLDFDGAYLDTELDVMWNGSEFYHCSALSYKNTIASGRYAGEFRFLRQGGTPTGNGQNYYEVYTNSKVDQLTLIQRYPSTGFYADHTYRNNPMPPKGITFVMRANKKNTGMELQIHPSSYGKITEPSFTGASGLAKLTIGAGLLGISEPSKMLWYGMIWRSGAISAEHEKVAAEYMGYLSGVDVG